MKKVLAISAAVMFLAAGCGSSTSQTQTPETTPTPTTQASATPTPSASPTTTEKTFSMADVAKANTPENCYSSINGNVYDLTAWINKHPGGDKAILSLCGKDGTSAFNGQHGGQMKPEKVLAGFEIGKLK